MRQAALTSPKLAWGATPSTWPAALWVVGFAVSTGSGCRGVVRWGGVGRVVLWPCGAVASRPRFGSIDRFTHVSTLNQFPWTHAPNKTGRAGSIWNPPSSHTHARTQSTRRPSGGGRGGGGERTQLTQASSKSTEGGRSHRSITHTHHDRSRDDDGAHPSSPTAAAAAAAPVPAPLVRRAARGVVPAAEPPAAGGERRWRAPAAAPAQGQHPRVGCGACWWWCVWWYGGG